MVILCISTLRDVKEVKDFERETRRSLLKKPKTCIEFLHAESSDQNLNKILSKRPPDIVVFNRGLRSEEAKRKMEMISRATLKNGDGAPQFKRVHDGDDLINGIINIPEIEHCLS